LEQLALPVSRCVVAIEVEPRLPDGDGPRGAEQLTQLVETLRVGLTGLVRVDAERGEDAVFARGDRQRFTARVDSGSARDAPPDSDGAGALADHVRRVGARVEVR